MKTKRIKRNRWGNWDGYEGRRKVIGFGTDEAGATAWAEDRERFRVFVYGTLKSGWWNHRLIEADGLSRFVGVAEVFGYTLRLGAIPFAVPSPGAKVRGEVWEVSHDTLQNLDLLEGHPNCYKREGIIATLEGGTMVYAWVYVYQRPEVVSDMPDGHTWEGKK